MFSVLSDDNLVASGAGYLCVSLLAFADPGFAKVDEIIREGVLKAIASKKIIDSVKLVFMKAMLLCPYCKYLLTRK